jgi:Protein of unknown function (DUF 659)
MSQWDACKAFYRDLTNDQGKLWRRQCKVCSKKMKLSTSSTNRFKHSLSHQSIKKKVLDAYEQSKRKSNLDIPESDPNESDVEMIETKRYETASKVNEEFLASNCLSAETSSSMSESSNESIFQEGNQSLLRFNNQSGDPSNRTNKSINRGSRTSRRRTRAESSLEDESDSNKKRHQRSLIDMLPPASRITEESDPKYSAAVLFASCSMAHRIIDTPWFNAHITNCRRAGNDYRPISRHQLVKKQESLSSNIKSQVTSKLASNRQASSVTLAVDGWTNKRKTKIMNVLLLKAGRAFYWASIPNRFKSQTGEFIFEKLEQVMEDLIQQDINVMAITADNESSNGKALGLLIAKFDFLVQVPCCAHTVQLIVRDVMESECISDLLQQVEEIIDFFRRNKSKRLELMNAQLKAGKKPRLFLLPCETRWSSELAAVVRVLDLHRWIGSFIDKTPEFWSQLNELVKFLDPFRLATDVVQSDAATLLDIYYQFMQLQLHAEKFSSVQQFAPAAEAAKHALSKRWIKQVNELAVISCALFSFVDPNDLREQFGSESIVQAKKYWLEIGANYLFVYKLFSASVQKLIDHIDAENLTDTRTDEEITAAKKAVIRYELDSQWKDMSLGNGHWSEFRVLATTAKRDAAVRAQQTQCKLREDGSLDDSELRHLFFDPRLIWADMLIPAPELATVACGFLSISPSEAAVERSFSHHGIVHSKRRFLLSDEHASDELQIKLNLPLLDCTSARFGHLSEMTENSDDQEPVKFGRLLLQSLQSETESSESSSSGEDENTNNSQDDESGVESERQRPAPARKPKPRPSRDNQSKERLSVDNRWQWKSVESMDIVAKKFIEEVNLTGPLKRWKQEVLVKLSDFIKRNDPRIQEVDLKKEIARQVNISVSLQQAEQQVQSAQQQQEQQPVTEQPVQEEQERVAE